MHIKQRKIYIRFEPNWQMKKSESIKKDCMTYMFIDGSSWSRLVIASEKLFVSLRLTTFPLMQTRFTLRGLIDRLLLNESFRDAYTSVWVACVFFTFRLIFSINSESVLSCVTLAKGTSCARNFSWPYWWLWCNWWWCKCSVELRAFLPPIKRSWLFVVFNRDKERSTDKSSNEVRVWERAKLTCFVLRNGKHLSGNWIISHLELIIAYTLAEQPKHCPMTLDLRMEWLTMLLRHAMDTDIFWKNQ